MKKNLFILLTLLLAVTQGAWATPSVAVNDKLPGAFSVSPTKVVYFSQGNLQYTKSTGKWKIMDHQYDMVETLYQNVGTDYADQDVVTLFGWGTSGWDNTAADATSVHYQPYATCYTNHSTANNNYQYGPSLANVAASESWSKEVAGNHPYENYDWGVFNSGDLGAGWRALTYAEWGYLFNTRTPGNSVNGVSNARYTVATINTDGTAVNGIILFPDDADMTSVSGVTWGSINSSSSWGTKCTSAGWTALETAGCVFLPAAGQRNGTSVFSVGSGGFYWSSSANSAANAYDLYFYSGGVYPQDYYDRYFGCSVRLVSDEAPAQPAAVIHDSDDEATIETFLSTNHGTEIAELKIDRPVLNNMYNTLCLPFDMNAAQIAASSLNGFEIYELEDVSVVNDELFLGLSDPKNAIVAGRPYIVKYSAASQLDDLDFENVTINNADLTAQAVTMNGVTFKGTFTPFVMGIQSGFDTNGGYLFLGQNNVLYWPNTNNPLKPFRAYFTVNVDAGQAAGMPVRRGMPARIGRPASTPAGVENVQGTEINAKKVIRDGQLIIMRNGVEYNANGQAIK